MESFKLCSWYIWLILGFLYGASCQSYYGNQDMLTQIKIGGLVDDPDPIQHVVLKQAVEHLNRDYNILENYHLSVKTENLTGNSFYTTRAVCSLMREGIAAIIGPQTSEASSHTQALCDRYDIPHIETNWDYKNRHDKYSINLFPHPDVLGQAYSDLIDHLGWTEIVIIYDDEAGLARMQTLIKNAIPTKRQIMFRPLPNEEDIKMSLKEIQRGINLNNIIIDCGYTRTLEILKQAQQIGMTYYIYNYMLTTLDIQEGDLDEFKHGDATFWTFRIVDPNQHEVQYIVNELNLATQSHVPSHGRHQYDFDGTSIYNSQMEHRFKGLTVGQALIYDAIKLLGKALQMNPESIRRIRPLECDREESWTEGSSIINDMRTIAPFQGLTGLIQFNNTGFRTDISLDIIQLKSTELKKAGVWGYTRSTKFIWDKIEEVRTPVISDSETLKLQNRTLKVASKLNPPFCMYKISEAALIGNERFEGFAIDLVVELAKSLGFEYDIHLVDSYPDFTKEIISGEADLVAADLTIKKDRQEIVDLTMPFMNIGIAILHTVPQAKPPSLFSFMSPFAIEVWMYVAFGFFGVSFTLFLTARVTPYEWDSPFPCIKFPEILHNQFSLANSFWFTIGSIMQQGSDLAPKAVSTRMVAGIWWFFTLIMVSSYTANLATFLIVQELEESIKSLDDLAIQNKILYGSNKNGSTMDFFKDSKDPTKEKIWSQMAKHFNDVMTSTNEQGIYKVVDGKGKYAFFLESSVLEYHQERVCGLRQVGTLLDNKGYGIALKKNSSYLNEFNGAILKLQEKGRLDELKRKWWKEERKQSNCEAGSVSDSVKPLQLANVGGVFVVLVVGCLIAVILTIAEFLWKSREFPINEGESLKHEILRDLQFALQCRGNVKPVKKTSISSEGGGDGDDVGGSGDLDYGWMLEKK